MGGLPIAQLPDARCRLFSFLSACRAATFSMQVHGGVGVLAHALLCGPLQNKRWLPHFFMGRF